MLPLFQKNDGNDYLLEYRLGKATELLENPNTNITEIAHAVGFNSVSNFSAVFKSKTGYTPRQFKESLLINEIS